MPEKIKCDHCLGTGKVRLGAVYADTLRLLRGYEEITGADLASVDGCCSATAMNNRLAVLEKHGLATSRVVGRRRLYKAKRRKR